MRGGFQENQSPVRIPKEDAPESDLRDFRDSFFNFNSKYRCNRLTKAAESLSYVVGDQWMEKDPSALHAGINGYIMRAMADDAEIKLPRPVSNYTGSAVEVELASLLRRKLVSIVIPTSKDPRDQSAARVSNQILEYRHKAVSWPQQRGLFTFDKIVTGTAVMRGFWDEVWTEMTRVPSPEAVKCQGCGDVLASPIVPAAMRNETAIPIERTSILQDEMVLLQSCPACGGALAPFALSPEQAMGADKLGRQLLVDAPKGNTNMEVPDLFEMFFENGGVGVDPRTCRIWGQATVRSLDWIEERWPDRIEEVKPEDPYELMRYHPLLGEWSMLSSYNKAVDRDIYGDHCRVFEVHADPSGRRRPKGRSIVLAGDVILENGPLLREVDTPQGKLAVKRVEYAAARFKIRRGEMYGHSLVDDTKSPQDRLNGMDGQAIQGLDMFGNPHLLMPEDMELIGPAWRPGYGMGKQLRFTPSNLNPAFLHPKVFPDSFPNVSAIYQQRSFAIDDVKNLAGPQAIEIGGDVTNISTTTGLVYHGEQADRRRAPREEEDVAAFERIWQHELEQIWTLRAEPDEMEIEEQGVWEKRQFDRLAIRGQTRVKIEKQSFVDRNIYEREAVREGVQDGLYKLETQADVKRVLEYRGLPTDVNRGLNRQVDLAQRQWADFIDNDAVPTIDTTLDDFRIHFQTIASLMLDDDGIKRAAQAKWPELHKLLAGWEEELLRLELTDAKTVEFYGGRPDPEAAQDLYVRALEEYDKTLVSWEAASEAAAETALETGMPPVLEPPPTPPPQPIFMPAAKEERVFLVFTNMLRKAGVQAQAVDQTFLRFRAVLEAYQLLAKDKERAELLASMPPQPAPGTPAGGPDQAGQPPLNPPPLPSMKAAAMTGHPFATQPPGTSPQSGEE